MSCLLRLSTPLKSNFKALFSSRNRLRAFLSAIVLLTGRCNGHKIAYRLRVQERARALVACTQDVPLPTTNQAPYCKPRPLIQTTLPTTNSAPSTNHATYYKPPPTTNHAPNYIPRPVLQTALSTTNHTPYYKPLYLLQTTPPTTNLSPTTNRATYYKRNWNIINFNREYLYY